MSTAPDVIHDARREMCRCTHSRFVHHHNLGCLARESRTRSGRVLCSCNLFKPDSEDNE